jgi:protein-tyrosine phosphatase
LKTILFLCSGNYYRSRFAEILFNHLAEELDLEWRAESRGIVAQWSHNPGPLSAYAVQGLAARSIAVVAPRYPRQLTEPDLENTTRVIALYEREHRPLLRDYFPQWADRVEYWNVPDLGEMNADDAFALIEQNVRSLIQTFLPLPTLHPPTIP